MRPIQRSSIGQGTTELQSDAPAAPPMWQPIGKGDVFSFSRWPLTRSRPLPPVSLEVDGKLSAEVE